MKTVLKMLAICMMAGGLGVQSVYAEPLVIQEQGSFLPEAPSSPPREHLTRKSRWTLQVKLIMAIMRRCSIKYRRIRINIP